MKMTREAKEKIRKQAQDDFDNGLRYEKAENSLVAKFGIHPAQARGYIINTQTASGTRSKNNARNQ